MTEQTIAVGPAASQIAIKQLGTNGGGFFNANSAHPLGEPDAAGQLYRIAVADRDLRRRCATRSARWWATRGKAGPFWRPCCVLFVPLLVLGYCAEQSGNPALAALGRRSERQRRSSRAETWKARRSATASPSRRSGRPPPRPPRAAAVNSMHDSYTPLGGLVAAVADARRARWFSAASAAGSTACWPSPSSPCSSPG